MEKFIAKVAPLENSRRLVNYLNTYGIKREDIVTILKEDEGLILIYYGRE